MEYKSIRTYVLVSPTSNTRVEEVAVVIKVRTAFIAYTTMLGFGANFHLAEIALAVLNDVFPQIAINFRWPAESTRTNS